tara:strand:- start:1775 stop:4303 length:2529 start_codon:yes stop_codon:yes gene_type:complete
MSDINKDTDNSTKTQQTIAEDLKALTSAAEPATGEGLKYLTIPPKDYDLDKIGRFLDAVFHAGLDEDENILTWIVSPTRSPAFPVSEEKMRQLLGNTRKASALYFATATCKRDADGKLYHRKKLFSSLRVVVLDDIGTKVAIDKIPAEFPPSYIIESSEGNFQYGYVLTEPVDTLEASEALVQLVYESGYSDEGGKTPVKLVRLPEGVNGKKGEKGPFISDLTQLTDITYTPQEILTALNIHVRWEDVLEDADAVTKSRASKSLGSTPWASISPKSQAMNGYIDPILEWLYEKGYVAHDNAGDWVDIKCPWHQGHTTGKDTARYKPLGRGENVDQRVFFCHHGHCKDTNNTSEFLKYIAVNSGIQAGAFDPSAALTTRYVFDKLCNSVWDIKSDLREMRIAMPSFSTLHPHKAVVHTVEGKTKLVAMTSLWAVSPSRVVVAGATYDPSTTARIVARKGENFVNLFCIPEWGHGPVDQNHIDTFTQYLDYLIPEKQDRDYFLMWLAAKCQDMSFRGAAIVMVANKQGVGRSTLADMIKTLLGATNVADVPFNEIVGEGQFNEWQEKPFIVSEETLSADPSKFYNNYEKLKTLVDPRSRGITINPKFGMKREVQAHGTYLFLTNHVNALAMPAEDRRFYVMNNALNPAAPQVFTALNNWLAKNDSDGMPSWGRSVYRWLQQYPVSIEELTAPPPNTEAKKDMAGASLSDIDFAVIKLLEVWPDPYVNASEIFRVFSNPVLAGPLRFDDDTKVKYVKRAVNDASTGYRLEGKTIWDTVNGTCVRPRLLNRFIGSNKTHVPLPMAGSKKDLVRAQSELTTIYASRELDLAGIASSIANALREDDRI